MIAAADADILVLQGIDYDLTAAALQLFAQQTNYPHYFASRPNTGVHTGLDMNGDGRRFDAADAQGYGRFSGQGGMAILSRFPIDTEAVTDFSQTLWRDFPQARLPVWDGRPFPSQEAQELQRLSSVAHWIVPIKTGSGPIQILTFHASPPVFDGPEDRNGLRNADEILFWTWLLDGTLIQINKFENRFQAERPFIIAGNANLDPEASDGRRAAIQELLAHRDLQDPKPRSAHGLATVDWPEPDDPRPGPGDLRVSYILPSTHWQVFEAQVMWPAIEDPFSETVATASRHRLIWVDLELEAIDQAPAER